MYGNADYKIFWGVKLTQSVVCHANKTVIAYMWDNLPVVYNNKENGAPK